MALRRLLALIALPCAVGCVLNPRPDLPEPQSGNASTGGTTATGDRGEGGAAGADEAVSGRGGEGGD